MAKKTEPVLVDGDTKKAPYPPEPSTIATLAGLIKENFASDAEANAQVADHYNVVLHHLAALESAIESYRKSKGGE